MPRYNYALVRMTDGHAIVLRNFRWDWLAMLVMRLMHWATGEVLEVAEVPVDPQSMINMHEEVMTLRDRLAELEERYGDAHPALVTLWQLVAKDEDGDWATVHDAGTKLETDATKLLDQLLGS